MKLRTSYFNSAVLRKDITRFAPVWALYTVGLLLIFSVLSFENAARLGGDISDIMTGMSWINLLYAGICANMLFGDLFRSRMCNALHAMPMRREGWFLTHVTAGLLFCIVPNLAGTLILAVMLQQYFYLALLWLALMVLQFLFFFGVGVFSVMCTGNRLAMAAVYLIINLFSLLTYVLVSQFYEPLLYGIQLDSAPYEFFCPLIRLTGENYLSFHRSETGVGIFGGFYPDAWHYLFGIAIIGAGLLAVSVLIYRHRKLECAGDFIALRCLEPVFLIIYTLAAGVAMYAFTALFGISGSYFFMAIGIIVGFFTGKMLLERTVKVFRLKSFLAFGIFAAVLAGSFLLTWLDPAGITRYVPETEDVVFMRVYRDNDAYVYGDADINCYQLDTPEEIEEFRNVHTQLMSEREYEFASEQVPQSGSVCQVQILYQLKDGTTVTRYYPMDESSAAWEALKKHFSAAEYIFNTEDLNAFAESIWYVDVGFTTSKYPKFPSNIEMRDPEYIRGLVEAIALDCAAGNMSQDYAFHPGEEYTMWIYMDSSMSVSWDDQGFIDTAGGFRDISIFSCCSNTMAFIDEFLETHETTE